MNTPRFYLASVLLTCVCLVGCSKPADAVRLQGFYASGGKAIDLRSDGTGSAFLRAMPGAGPSGKYSVSGNSISLQLDNGVTMHFLKQGEALQDQDNSLTYSPTTREAFYAGAPK